MTWRTAVAYHTWLVLVTATPRPKRSIHGAGADALLGYCP